MKQLIYRRDSNAKFTDVNAAGFVYCQCNNDISSISTILAANFGRLGLWKKRVKLWIGRRAFFGIISENQLVHYGWVSFGFCKHYKIEKTNAVIGPVWTSENNRGKGLATIALKLSINRILECGWRGIYIDTTEDNLAMQRVIHRCDFNTLVGTYVRSNDKTPGQSLISTLKKCFPQWLIRFGRHFIDMASRDRARWQREYNAVLAQAKPVPVNNALPRLGIIKDTMQRHSYYEAACLELGVPYELLDITGPDWVDVVRQSDCAAYLVRPFVLTSIGKRLYDERVRMMNEDLGKHVFPSVKSLWLYESKRRTAGWLAAHKIPQPTTWVFNDQPAALTFATGCEFPIVFKTDLGSEALGVEIVRDRTALCRLIKLCFGRGVAAEGYNAPGMRGERFCYRNSFQTQKSGAWCASATPTSDIAKGKWVISTAAPRSSNLTIRPRNCCVLLKKLLIKVHSKTWRLMFWRVRTVPIGSLNCTAILDAIVRMS